MEKKQVRLEYSQKILAKLNIKVNIENSERLPKSGQYLILSNHRSIIDPLIIDIALQNTKIFGLWVSKKELWHSMITSVLFGCFIIFSLGCFEDLYNLYDLYFRVHLGDGLYQSSEKNGYYETESEGKIDSYARWHGEVKTTTYDYNTEYKYKNDGPYHPGHIIKHTCKVILLF